MGTASLCGPVGGRVKVREGRRGKRSAEVWFLQILVVKLLSGRTEMI